MKTGAWIFGLGIFFFAPVAIVYGFLTDFTEWVGLAGLILVGGIAAMVASGVGVAAVRDRRRLARPPPVLHAHWGLSQLAAGDAVG